MAALNLYQIGDLVRVVGTLTTAGDMPVDPDALVCRVKAPNGTITTHTYGTDPFPARDSAGIYHVDVTPAQVGEYRYEFRSTGTGQAMDDGMFVVEAGLI